MNIFKRNNDTGNPGETTTLTLERYLHLRKILNQNQDQMLKHVSGSMIKASAKMVGIWHRGTIVFEDEQEMPVLMDFAIYNHRLGPRSLIEVVRAKMKPEPGSDEEMVFDAMTRSRYSIYAVERTVPSHGILLDDLLRKEKLMMFDRNLGRTAIPGLVMAGRLIPVDGHYISTGAMMALSIDAIEEITRSIDRRFGTDRDLAHLTGRNATDLQALVIKVALSYEPDIQMKYE